MTRLSGKIGLFTGGALGIGRAISLMLADQGAEVAVSHAIKSRKGSNHAS